MATIFVPSDRSICLDITQRQPYSFDFLACEGFNGWSAAHVMTPFVVMLFFGNFPLAWLAAGLVEIAEALRPTLFGLGAMSSNPAGEFETLAGSILGDWAMNDLLGILAAHTLLHLFSLPSLFSGIYKCSSSHRGRSMPRARMWSVHWWKQHIIFLVFMGINVLPAWVYPKGCNPTIPGACINAGLMLSVGLQLILIVLCAVWFMRSYSDEKYLWLNDSVSLGQRRFLFVAWFIFILAVGLQNAQPYVPLWFVPLFAEFAQVWLFALIWLVTITCLGIARIKSLDIK